MAAASPVLALDAGNTRIKWGLNVGGRWVARGATLVKEAQKLGRDWPPLPEGTIAKGCNVAGIPVELALYDACGNHGLELSLVTSQAEQLGVKNAYRDPGQLGADRWAALIAAHRASEGHKLVVNVGTALTVDALRGDGLFLGGLIVPGPALMRASLTGGTAGLRLTEGHFDPFPRSTPDAITTGAVQAAIGAIERMAAAMAQSNAAPECIVLAGGAASILEPHLSRPVTLNDNLVLDGVALVARAGR
jgi:type III pantothenate kinase